MNPQPTTIPGQTPIQRAAEVTRLNQHCAPLQIVIHPGLKPGQWYVVRALSQAERAVVDHVIAPATR